MSVKAGSESGAIPVSPSLGEVDHEMSLEQKGYPVGKRVFYLSLRLYFNAIIVGLVARLLVSLIDLITNISFYGKFSFADMSPANNHLGCRLVIFCTRGWWPDSGCNG